jgi:adenylate cyclase class IV
VTSGGTGARNVEWKARARDLAAVERRTAQLATEGPLDLEQDDTFFACPAGRLKLREFSGDRGELIFYRRADTGGPKLSRYIIAPTPAPAALREALELAYGVIGRVRKRRRLYLVGRTRVHLDRVEGLGDFVEIEVVLAREDRVEDGEAEARELMHALGVGPADLVVGAYLDLLSRDG